MSMSSEFMEAAKRGETPTPPGRVLADMCARLGLIDEPGGAEWDRLGLTFEQFEQAFREADWGAWAERTARGL